jgi:hypothetical protein
MFSGEVRRMLIQVISSWQVIAVTIVLVIYISVVKYVARIYNSNSRSPRISLTPKKAKKKKPEAPAPTTDEFNLGEESKE